MTLDEAMKLDEDERDVVDIGDGAYKQAKQALATTPESVLSEVRKAEREKCAALCEKSDRYRGDYFAAKIRAMGDE